MKVVSVVAAVIIRDSKVFATQRGYGPMRHMWEFPGGKIESGESPRQALEREIYEELGCRIAVEESLGTIHYDYPDFHLDMQCLRCSLDENEHLSLLEHEAARWLDSSTLMDVEWLPADLQILPAIKELLSLPSEPTP